MQVAVLVMCGGGFVGDLAMTQLEDFYIDDRAGRLPYPRYKIYDAVEVLDALATRLNPDLRVLKRPKLDYFGWFID